MADLVADFQVRRIVTGPGPAGRATVSADGPAAERAVTPEFAVVNLWSSPRLPADTGAGDGLVGDFTIEPPAGALKVMQIAFAPDARRHDPSPGGESPGMHRTQTVDVVTLLRGELHCVLDDGEVRMRPGDTLVQRGTPHAWVNKSDETAVAVVTILSAT